MQNDTQTWYLTASEGFRRGGINAVPTEGPFIEESGWVPFSSDSVKNFEVGTKGVGNYVNYDNVSIYNIIWSDPQLNTETQNYSFYAVINGDKAETKGLDIELQGSVGQFDWDIGYASNSSSLKADLLTPASIPQIYANNGDELPGTPRNMMNAGIAHTGYLTSGWGIVSRANIYYQSDMKNHLNRNSRFAEDLDGFKIVDVSSTFFVEDMYISLFVKNVLNERGVTAVFTDDGFGPDPSQGFFGSNDREFIALPRTFGISIEKSF